MAGGIEGGGSEARWADGGGQRECEQRGGAEARLGGGGEVELEVEATAAGGELNLLKKVFSSLALSRVPTVSLSLPLKPVIITFSFADEILFGGRFFWN